ncbi:MAG: hypothetical protein M1837_000340 [Sclerophora amabilis]|nr:MAG: hypothetical protein M1837_000340 [Sclerophora amabilis]
MAPVILFQTLLFLFVSLSSSFPAPSEVSSPWNGTLTNTAGPGSSGIGSTGIFPPISSTSPVAEPTVSTGGSSAATGASSTIVEPTESTVPSSTLTDDLPGSTDASSTDTGVPSTGSEPLTESTPASDVSSGIGSTPVTDASSTAGPITPAPTVTPTEAYGVISTVISGSTYDLTYVEAEATAATQIVQSNAETTTTEDITAGGFFWTLPTPPVGFPFPPPGPPPGLPKPPGGGSLPGCIFGCGGSNNDDNNEDDNNEDDNNEDDNNEDDNNEDDNNEDDNNEDDDNEDDNNEDDNEDDDNQSQTATQTASSSSCTSTAIPQCTEKVNLATSISGTITSVKTETTSECSTITACTGEAQTESVTTGTVTSTSEAELCAATCSACNNNDPHPSASSTATPSALAKRALTAPSDPPFGGDVVQFLLSEYAWAEWVPHREGVTDGQSSALARRLGNQRYDMAVRGLYGCTSVVVVSNRGVYMSHFWEVPSFQDLTRFRADVINNLYNGDGSGEMPGLSQFAGAGGEFDSPQRPAILVVTPRRRGSQTPGDYLYGPMLDEITTALKAIIPGPPVIPFDYVPRSDDFSQFNTAAGKILFQYDPAHAMINNPNDPCRPVQQAMVRVWIEDRPMYAYQKYWNAEPDQVVAGNQKRQESADACSLSQTASATTGVSDSETASEPVDTASTQSVPAPTTTGPSSVTSEATEPTSTEEPPPPTTTEPPPPPTTTEPPPPPETTEEPPPPPPETTEEPPPPPPPYATGTCNIHVWQGLGQAIGTESVYFQIAIADADGAVIGEGDGGLGWGETLEVESKLADIMKVTPQSGLDDKRIKREALPAPEAVSADGRPSKPHWKRIGVPAPPRPLFRNGPVEFAIKEQAWDTSSEECSVGDWDNGDANDFFGTLIFGDEFVVNRQMDCKFPC